MTNILSARRRGRDYPPFYAQILLVFLAAGLLLLGGAFSVTLHIALSLFQEQVDTNLTAVATSLADSAMVKKAFSDGKCPPELIDYLDDLTAMTPELDVISIAGTDSVRIYHVVHERIGGDFVGGDEGRALAGERYFSDAVGTLGLQHRYFAPVWDADGTVLGFVMVSTTMDRVKTLENEITATYVRVAVVFAFALLAFAALLTLLLRRILLGFTPEGMASTYLVQNEALNGLDEGVVLVDEQGRILMVNRSAESILGQQEEQLLGSPLDALLRAEGGESLLKTSQEEGRTSRPNILATTIVPNDPAHLGGTTLILKDRRDAMRRAEQLNGTRHIISALRANSHEFMNKLQVISGLLQMGRAEDALEYIGHISVVQAKDVSPIVQRIRNANVAALLLGKLDNTRELDIQLTLLPNSDLPERSQYLSSRDLVTVVGNLLENAIEAVNAQSADAPRSIDLQISEREEGLLILVSDTGVGIRPEQLAHIYESGFSTKAAEGRGVGMALVHDIVERCSGSIEVDSELGSGTTFTLIFNQKRRGESEQ